MRYKFLILIILTLCVTRYTMHVVHADENTDKIAELRQKIEELTKQAEMYRGNVLEKQQEANTLKQQIALLNAQIGRLEAEIGITERRITSAEIQMHDLQEKIVTTQRDIEFKKATIGQMMGDMYERDRLGLFATLVKNPNISDFANEAQQSSSLNERLGQLISQLRGEKIKLDNFFNQKNRISNC